ncbi:hypothetical protein [Stratiformator vulcanicus]|uniref:Uncharacterized protein n=1 Tax=Stratiformator vulcanicus TaxID=2527980 RepID=A0A517R4J8_9PLAN|nr:hypothetical protein [Stratiformator vulcanicus]QDT38809.1 hypothetical protein Pan189_32080 [Stratiformator vulcanicus]
MPVVPILRSHSVRSGLIAVLMVGFCVVPPEPLLADDSVAGEERTEIDSSEKLYLARLKQRRELLQHRIELAERRKEIRAELRRLANEGRESQLNRVRKDVEKSLRTQRKAEEELIRVRKNLAAARENESNAREPDRPSDFSGWSEPSKIDRIEMLANQAELNVQAMEAQARAYEEQLQTTQRELRSESLEEEFADIEIEDHIAVLRSDLAELKFELALKSRPRRSNPFPPDNDFSR